MTTRSLSPDDGSGRALHSCAPDDPLLACSAPADGRTYEGIDEMRAPWLVPFLTAAFIGCVALPASAAPPVRSVDPVDEEEEAFLTGLLSECGVPVAVEGSGRSTETVFTNNAGTVVRVQVVFATRYVVTNLETGTRFTVRDVGPDRLLFDDGVPVEVQLIGRSLTGSGVIGRTVVDLTGDEPVVVSSSGRTFGVPEICAAIT